MGFKHRSPRRWARGIIGYSLNKLTVLEIIDEADTTMDIVPAPPPSASAALRQRRGRGRTGPWQSPSGGAWLTLHYPAPPVPALALAAAGCLAKMLNQLLPRPSLHVKWPNDVVDNKLRKVAGILIERRSGYTSVGIGVNVYNTPPPGASSLAQHGYTAPLAAALLAALDAATEAILETAKCAEEAAQLDALKGRVVTLDTPMGAVTGTARGLDPQTGAILLETGGKVARITCCHVKLIHRHSAMPPP